MAFDIGLARGADREILLALLRLSLPFEVNTAGSMGESSGRVDSMTAGPSRDSISHKNSVVLRDPAFHGFAFTKLVQHNEHVDLVQIILEENPERTFDLATAKAKGGQSAIDLASTLCKEAIQKSLFFFRRYEILSIDNPVHASSTTLLHCAIDHEDANKSKVALKFLRNKEQFQAEIEAREQGIFSSDYIVGVLAKFDSDESEEVRRELTRKGLGFFPYVIGMHFCSKNLLEIIASENVAGKRLRDVKTYGMQIGV